MTARILAALSFLVLGHDIRAETGFIAFGEPKLLDGGPLQRQRAWEAVDPAVRKSIETYLLRHLGLSSTGSISLIGYYSVTGHDALGPEGSRVFHFIQRDLGGARLFWSCLANPQNRKVRILYQCGAPYRYGFIETIATEN